MTQKEILKNDEITAFLSEARDETASANASFMVDGKWRLLDLEVCEGPDDVVSFHCVSGCECLKKDHPVGICVHWGHFKYLFDSTALAVEPERRGIRISLHVPDKIERLPRRAYHRQPVPADTKVKVLFWHRGYLDEMNNNIKPEELYWQGRLLNLSAGGAQFEIEIEQKEHFQVGQLLGVQFTPMSYEKPLLLESHVRYLKEQPDNVAFRIGVEFLGLEASPEGRKILERILEVIEAYEKMGSE